MAGAQKRKNKGQHKAATHRGAPGTSYAHTRSSSTSSGSASSVTNPVKPSPSKVDVASMDGPADDPQPPSSVQAGTDQRSATQAAKTRGVTNTRMELGAEFYKSATDTPFTPRPKYPSPVGKPIRIKVNQFKVASWTTKTVYQYDVLIGTGDEKGGKVKKVWQSKAVQDLLKKVDQYWLFDGSKLAWCMRDAGDTKASVMVDLDKESGRTPRPGKGPDTCRFVIKRSTAINMSTINAYLGGQMSYIPQVGEALNFLDHCLRQYPSEKLIAVKRSFFGPGENRFLLDTYLEAIKGVYASMRLSSLQGSLGPSSGLGVNADVANGTFWVAQPIHQMAKNLTRDRGPGNDYTNLARSLKPIFNEGYKEWNKSRQFQELSRLRKLKFTVKHRGNQSDPQVYTVMRVVFDQQYEGAGATARSVKFEQTDQSTGASKLISVYDYFKQKYNVQLQHPDLPLIEANRGGFFPMECCVLVPNQRYNYKLDPDQTSKMIKFAVTRPGDRLRSIQHGLSLLNWAEDPYLKHFGVKIDSNMTDAKARLLEPPQVLFANNQRAAPGTSGRWDLRGKRFLVPNTVPLKNWGVCVINGAVDPPAAKSFVKAFVQAYTGHGGIVPNRDPDIFSVRTNDAGAAATQAWTTFQRKYSVSRPDMIFFILPSRDSFYYERLKKTMECRYGQVSQMIQGMNARKAAPQYCSNVAMKVNAKLGGATAQATGLLNGASSYFSVPTMIIGADVSHAAPGGEQASMAAMTMSLDKFACRYAAAVETNGHRVEMITQENIEKKLIPMIDHWGNQFKTLPKHIYYLRDGVAENQFQMVLDSEVDFMKKAIKQKWPKLPLPQFTVIICGKRHHIRMFPERGFGDRNGNAEPGTVLDSDVTHPFQYDFYLNSHSALQGTARPMHYQVILDEAQVDPAKLECMLYHHCYQFIRSTTPVSMHPAVYYAHIASLRARAHENFAASDGPRGGQKGLEHRQEQAMAGQANPSLKMSGSMEIQAKALLPMALECNDPVIKRTFPMEMWYI